MPANLSPAYFEAEQRYKRARTPEEKLNALEEMLSVIPKHKGTEKLQGDIKSRISKCKKQAARDKQSRGKAYDPFLIEQAGGAQVAVIGPPNSGKSTLLAVLTNARPEVGDYPFTTNQPSPGMMDYEDVQIQLIDFPPIAFPEIEGNFSNALRRVDAVLLVIDLHSNRVLEELETVLSALEKAKISFAAPPNPSWYAVKALVIANKCENTRDRETLEVLKEFFSAQLVFFPVSLLHDPASVEELRGRIFQLVEVIRVYSKKPGESPDLERPFVLKRGSTVYDLASAIHKDIACNLKTARIWGSAKFDGQRVTVDHKLEDTDIVEIQA